MLINNLGVCVEKGELCVLTGDCGRVINLEIYSGNKPEGRTWASHRGPGRPGLSFN